MTALSTEDSASLGDAVRRMLQDRYAFAGARRHDITTPASELPTVWAALVELGLAGLAVPEARGGFGGGPADLQRVQREMGRALVVSPWLGVALAALVIERAAGPAQQAAWLGALAEGSMTIALAQAMASPLGAVEAPTLARPVADGWRIDGRKADVLHAAAVSHLLVSARQPDGSPAWFLVDAAQAGVQVSAHRLVDQSWCAEVSFSDAPGDRLDGPTSDAGGALLAGELHAVEIAAYCAEMAGGAQAALDLTVQYLRTRQQFGQPLGDYQALRHRVAEMYIAMEQVRSAEEMAQEATGMDDAAARARRAAQAQLVACEWATWITRQAIQLHGGMGMTDELAVGHHYQRQLVINALTGGEAGALAVLQATG